MGYLSKYKNQKGEASPTLPTLKKMAKVSTTVTYAELLEAAGYEPEKYDEQFDRELADETIAWTPANTILPALYNTDFKWKFVNAEAGSLFAVELEDAPFDKWYFIPVTKETVSKEDITAILGCKEAEVIQPHSKVTFVTANADVYRELKEMEFPLLTIWISVVRVNANSLGVEKEENLKTNLEMSEKVSKFVLQLTGKNDLSPLSLD